MDGTYGLPRDTKSLIDELKKLIHGVDKIKIVKYIKPKYAVKYVHRVIFG